MDLLYDTKIENLIQPEPDLPWLKNRPDLYGFKLNLKLKLSLYLFHQPSENIFS